MRGRAGVVAALTLAAWSATALTAAAAPKGEVFEFDCGETTYDVVFASNNTGHWAVAHVVGGGVHVPTAFQVTSIDGVPTGSERFPKGNSGRNQVIEDCSFSITFQGSTYEAVVSGYFVR